MAWVRDFDTFEAPENPFGGISPNDQGVVTEACRARDACEGGRHSRRVVEPAGIPPGFLDRKRTGADGGHVVERLVLTDVRRHDDFVPNDSLLLQRYLEYGFLA